MTTGKAKSKPSGKVVTNTNLGSVIAVKHAAPVVELYARVAVSELMGMFSPKSPSLHFLIVIWDSYSGFIGVDGQPTADKKIRTNFYRAKSDLPGGIVSIKTIHPPSNMSAQTFADRLIVGAKSFEDGVLNYSFPDNVFGEKMGEGEYNSSSYVAGLLGSVMGYVPSFTMPGYQMPGWENPIPFHCFRKHVR
ncbi:hypothetical protein [Hydromonas duriensis]|uniref:Uncharacterized protein n=1 Tax=Hydromonas duriensis TaxID=1527608 RepID=A0A4R6Y570_9BURK|nr:hypothetical protein [Hydromonas duriensis]TDR27728.1 hypothetical protein DFR44_1422 [Hydromonas duriensis]